MVDSQPSVVHDSNELILVNPEIEEFAQLKSFPIVNRLVGVFLETQARMINAKRVFEFGSGYGYSAFWFAMAVGADGCINCSDADAMNRKRAERYLSAAALS